MLTDVERISVSPVFVGRSAELAELTAALKRAGEGQPQALLIAGDAGVGKTRLLEEFVCAATARGAVVAVGGCVEIGADGLPYAPLVSVLRALHRELGDEVELAAAGSEGRLAQLLPELGQAVPEAHDEFGRARLFEHTAQLFERLSADRVVVLALEDLHWSDRSTRELLVYLLRSLRNSRVVIVGTYRSDDLHRRHPLRPFLAELERLRTVQRLELPRLGRGEVADQLTGILDSAPAPQLITKIFLRSEGIPFFVEELAASYQEGCSTGLTDSLRDLLLVRVEALPEPVQPILRTIAQGGSAVEYGLLRAVLELPEDELIAALRLAVDANILRPTQAGDGYRFRHALVREAVADDLLPGEGSRIKRRYATVLGDQPQLVPAEERTTRLANYWYSAGDPARALPAVLDAGREARRRNAFAEQLQMLERALELWERVPEETLAELRPADYAESYPACSCDDDPGQECCGRLRYLDVIAEAAVAARLCGERERCLSLCKQALRMIDESVDPARAAWFWAMRSRVKSNTGMVRDAGRDELAHARQLVENRPPSAVQAEVFSRLAACDMVDWPEPDDIALAERAVRIARQVGAETVELHARCTLGTLLVILGREAEGLTELKEVLSRARELQEPDLMSRAYVNLSDVYEGLGRSAEAAEAARSGCEMARRNGLLGAAGPVLRGNLIESLFSLGRLDEGAELLDAAAPDLGSEADRSFLSRLRAALALLRDELPDAAAHLALAVETLNLGNAQNWLPLSELAIRLPAAEGRFADARAELLRVLDVGFPKGKSRYVWPLLVHGVAAEADSRGLPGADPGRAQVLERVRAATADLEDSWPLARGWALLLDAELARAEGALDPKAYLRAVEALEPVALPYPLDLALFRAAEGEAVRGDRTAASALLRRAEAAAERHGDVRLLREAARLADRARLNAASAVHAEGRAGAQPGVQAGARTGAAAPVATADPTAAAFGLTPREQGVLQLVALGRTNRQIAQELYISPKTASVHVSNILAKLEVAGRGEAAAMAHRLRLVGDLAVGADSVAVPATGAATPAATPAVRTRA
ncbi:DNA-binding CsgD family transcriptional regulator/tetratricopeptide (TPR) repeat protein [Streptacidiphilus sp. MAP12-16]|uniref:helix-turn-helix transcriptional regulator n=1 Tax=Streptacidiphilus sp. MAP12-16 TaxID=3156300 RepID=UPI003511711A